MALLPVYDRQVDPTFQAAEVGGDWFPNDEATEALVVNGGFSAITVMASATRLCGHGVLDHWIKVVDPGEVMRFGPFLGARFNDSSGWVNLSYTGVTGVSVAAQRQK
jgi:hypothetical protein